MHIHYFTKSMVGIFIQEIARRCATSLPYSDLLRMRALPRYSSSFLVIFFSFDIRIQSRI
ncbi:hypothetical protein CGJ20_18995 [Vibrio parahaemolyticus]|nr:hypothetical protein CGJ20_18995 [Vibrio parahaemolyticus]